MPTFDEYRELLERSTSDEERHILVSEMVVEYMPKVLSLSRILLHRMSRPSGMQSEDLCQSVCIRLLDRLREGKIELRSEARFISLLRMMVENRLIEVLRRKQPISRPSDELPNDPVSDAVQRGHTIEAVWERLQKHLQVDELYLFQRRFLDGAKFPEIAAEFGLEVRTVEMRVSRLLEKVRDKLADLK